MALERRDHIKQEARITVRAIEEDNLSAPKPFVISKLLVMAAYKRVKENKGAAGVDQQSLDQFDHKLKNNLYKIWNRMSSGNYFPPAVRAVPIPKKSGGERILGIPTVADRIAQMVVKMTFEPMVEPHFHPDSYGYRPNKNALDAVGVVRQRCWKNDWVLEFDIKGLFDNIDHNLLMKSMHAELRSHKIPKKTRESLPEIARQLNPIIRGWLGYYGCYTKTALNRFKRHIDDLLIVWAMRKYKKLEGRITAAGNFIKRIRSENPRLFAHWV